MHSCRVQKPTQIENWRWQWNMIEEKETQCRQGFPLESHFIHYEPWLNFTVAKGNDQFPSSHFTCSIWDIAVWSKDETLTNNPRIDTQESLIVQAFTKFYSYSHEW
jgi:hypothetical protein